MQGVWQGLEAFEFHSTTPDRPAGQSPPRGLRASPGMNRCGGRGYRGRSASDRRTMPGKRSRIRGSSAYASTSSYLDATSVTRHKTPALMRGKGNAWTEVDAEASLARFPASRCSGMLRSRPRPDIPASAATFRPTPPTSVVAYIESRPTRVAARAPARRASSIQTSM
jgi:hypothetical protein